MQTPLGSNVGCAQTCAHEIEAIKIKNRTLDMAFRKSPVGNNGDDATSPLTLMGAYSGKTRIRIFIDIGHVLHRRLFLNWRLIISAILKTIIL